MLIKRQIANTFPLFIYGVGGISLLLLDILITKYLAHESISDWAELKSYMMIIGPLLTLGLGNLFIRYPSNNSSIIKTSLIVFPISLCLLVIFFYIKSENDPIYITICIAIYSITIYASNYNRARLKFFLSQAILNAWKIIAVLLVAVSIGYGTQNISISLIVALALFLSLWLLGLSMSKVKNLLTKTWRISAAKVITKDQFMFSIKMAFSNFTVSASMYLEILLVSNLATSTVTANYFNHFTIFCSTFSFFSGYLGFMLAPLMSKNPKKWEKILLTETGKIIIYCFCASFVVGAMFFVVFGYVYHLPPLVILSALMVIASSIRIIYLFPTSYMAAWATSGLLNYFLCYGLLGLLVFAIVFWILFKILVIGVIYSVIIASLSNWCIRTISAYIISKKIIVQKG